MPGHAANSPAFDSTTAKSPGTSGCVPSDAPTWNGNAMVPEATCAGVGRHQSAAVWPSTTTKRAPSIPPISRNVSAAVSSSRTRMTATT